MITHARHVRFNSCHGTACIMRNTVYSTRCLLFVVFLLELILRIDYTLHLVSPFQPNSDEPLLRYTCIIP